MEPLKSIECLMHLGLVGSIVYFRVNLFIYLFILLPPDTFPVHFFLSFHPCLPLFLSPSRICYNYLKEDSMATTVLK